jgi:outer membrane usher protein
MGSRSPSPSQRPRRAIAAALAGAAVFASASTAFANTLELAQVDEAVAIATASASIGKVLVFDVVVNGTHRGQGYAFLDEAGVAHLELERARAWMLNVDAMEVRDAAGLRFVRLDPRKQTRTTIDWKLHKMEVVLPVSLMRTQGIDLARNQTLTFDALPFAGFFNYSLFGYHSGREATGSALLEAGLSGPHGVLLGTFGANTATRSGETNSFVRWDSYWRRDFTHDLTTLVVGDAVTAAGPWGRSTRFGGVQYGRNFQIQPSLVTYPLQAVAGVAVVPSTVDVLVNGSRVTSQEFQPGPFSIDNIPTVTGSGEIQMVVRDAFGQQQVVSQAFYVGRNLLREGLTEYQVSFGAVRQNYGIKNADYGETLLSAFWRGGITDRVTLDSRLDATTAVQSLGLGADWSAWLPGTFSLGGSVSSSERFGIGYAALAGYEFNSPHGSFSARLNLATPDYRVGTDGFSVALRRQGAVAGSLALGRYGSVGAAYAEQKYGSTPATRITSVSYTAPTFRGTFVGISLSHARSLITQTSAWVTLSVPLGNGASAAVQAQSTRVEGRERSYASASVQQPAPSDSGFGYQLRATTDERFDAGLSYVSPHGAAAVEASSAAGSSALRANVTGGIGVIGGRLFASRAVVDSFALVRVADVEGIAVYREGNRVGTTGSDGAIIVPRVMPYHEIRIGIDEKHLPADTAVRSREVRVVAPYRTGVIVDMPVTRIRSVSATLLFADGSPVPAGKSAVNKRTGEALPIGYGGFIYIEDAVQLTTYVVDLDKGRCFFQLPAEVKDVAHGSELGPYTCQREAP